MEDYYINARLSKFPTVILFILLLTFRANGQIQISTYLDAGRINVSEEGVVKTAVLADYHIGKIALYTGGQLEFQGPSPNEFTGFYLKGGYEVSAKKFPFDVQGLFLLNPYSDIIHEWSLGLLLNAEQPHFTYKLGTNFRKYYITNKAKNEYDIGDNSSLFEKWNVMYLLGYRLKPRDHHWNAGITVTNIDYFLINQETNPMIYLRGSYAISDPFSVYLETWYKSAGTFNIGANTFGYFFRAGVIWSLK